MDPVSIRFRAHSLIPDVQYQSVSPPIRRTFPPSKLLSSDRSAADSAQLPPVSIRAVQPAMPREAVEANRFGAWFGANRGRFGGSVWVVWSFGVVLFGVSSFKPFHA